MECLKNEVDFTLQLGDLSLDSVVDLIEKGKLTVLKSLTHIYIINWNNKKKEFIHDVLIVPVSVCYEKFPFEELFQKSRGVKSSSFRIFKTILKFISKCLLYPKSFGQVRVNFSQPFSLNVNLTELIFPIILPFSLKSIFLILFHPISISKWNKKKRFKFYFNLYKGIHRN